jgi:hypothetical protein
VGHRKELGETRDDSGSLPERSGKAKTTCDSRFHEETARFLDAGGEGTSRIPHDAHRG